MKINLKSPNFIIPGIAILFSLAVLSLGYKNTIQESKTIKADPVKELQPSPSAKNKTIQPLISPAVEAPSHSVVKIGAACEQYMMNSNTDKIFVEHPGEKYLHLCRSVDEFVAAGIKYPKAFNLAEPESLKTRLLYACQNRLEVKKEPICIEILATPGLLKTNYIAVDESDLDTPVPAIIKSVRTEILGGNTAEVVGKQGNLVKVIVNGFDVNDNDISEETILVESKYVKVFYKMP